MKELYFRTLYSVTDSGYYRRRIVERFSSLSDVIKSITPEELWKYKNELPTFFGPFLTSTVDLFELQKVFEEKRALADEYDLLRDHNIDAWRNLKKIADDAENIYTIALVEATIINDQVQKILDSR